MNLKLVILFFLWILPNVFLFLDDLNTWQDYSKYDTFRKQKSDTGIGISCVSVLLISCISIYSTAYPFFGSCMEMKKICETFSTENSQTEKTNETEEKTESVKNIAPESVKNIAPESVKNIDPESVRNIDPESVKNIDPGSFQEIGNEFISLTRAWSPMLLSIFCSESIILIMAGFALAKQEAENTTHDSMEIYTTISLLLSTATILFCICYMCEGTHSTVLECVSMVK